MAKLFISYSRVNLQIVQKLRQDLQNAGIDIWIDQVGLTPGTPDWDQALRDAIREASAVLLVASPDSRRSPYVRDEVAIAKDAKKPIYPLWVAGDNWIDCIPMGLGSTQNVDLRDDAYNQNLPRLIGSLGGQTAIEQEPVPIITEDEPETPPPTEPRNPYKGLRAFQLEDQNDFFGRDALIEEFLDIVADNKRPARLLAVLGASGSGKSSVMMAGLLPRLKQDYPDWTFLDPIVPGTNPIEKLTIMLARQFENKSQKAIREDLLDRTTRGLHGLVCELSSKPVVLYIDQFEELFTLVDKEADRRHFIDILTTAVTEPDGVLYLLLSMRADFYDRPLQYNNFGKLIENHHVAVTPMTLADLYDVVQKPAQLSDVSVTFEDGLVTEMVFAVREETAALPLLQFTLDQLFEARHGHKLTLQAYQDLGGIQGALAGHADATYAKLPSDQHRHLARTLFLRLIEPGQTEQDTTRRRATYSELTLPDIEQTRILQETAESFVNARLLVTDQSGDDRTIEVSHEALILEWKRLGDWLHDAREDLRLQKKIISDARDWVLAGKPTNYGGFYTGMLLIDAINWAQSGNASVNEKAFIESSQHREKQISETAENQMRAFQFAAADANEQGRLARENTKLAENLKQQALQQTKLAQENVILVKKYRRRARYAYIILTLAIIGFGLLALIGWTNFEFQRDRAVAAKNIVSQLETQMSERGSQLFDSTVRHGRQAVILATVIPGATEADLLATQIDHIAPGATQVAELARVNLEATLTAALIPQAVIQSVNFDGDRREIQINMAYSQPSNITRVSIQMFEGSGLGIGQGITYDTANYLPNPIIITENDVNNGEYLTGGTYRVRVWVNSDTWIAAHGTEYEFYLAPSPPTITPTATPKPTNFTPVPIETALQHARAGVNSNEEWLARYPGGFIQEFDGIEMVLVPAGQFVMGSTDEEIDYGFELCQQVADNDAECQRSWFEDEVQNGDNTQIFTTPFWIDKYEVSREEYAECVRNGACTETGLSDFSTADNQPINQVTWFQAVEYCAYRNSELPTEAQWEYAARGPDRLLFPWGNEFDGSEANHCDSNCNEYDWGFELTHVNSENNDGYNITASVTNYETGESWVGARNMAGNVREWTSSLDGDYPYNDSREDANNESDVRVLRGGSFFVTVYGLRSADRFWGFPGAVNGSIGFRCARDLE